MEDKKPFYTYTYTWKQSYDGPSQEWVAQAQDDIVESKLNTGDFTEAQAVLKRIMSL